MRVVREGMPSQGDVRVDIKGKAVMYEERKYRDLFRGINLEFFDVCVMETDLRIGAASNVYEEAHRAVLKYREQIETYIRLQPQFLTSLQPVCCLPGAAEIIRRMCAAAELAGVGPMAAVAGAVSEMVGNDLLRLTPEIIVENGGDIFMKSRQVRKIGIYAGTSPLSEKISLVVSPEKTPVGICTSSGTVGHSLSFGRADAAVILARDAFLADAVATATGNRVREPADIDAALEFASGIPGVTGALIIIGDKLGAWGDVVLAPF